ncbi:MAG: sialate O-acetylesterase [bacterium]|jgi:sialate O-acetylesterase
MRHLLTLAIAAALLPAGCAQQQQAERGKSRPFVSTIFGDNMVLQRGKANTFWGWSEPGDRVTVEVAGKSASAVAGQDGRWEVKLEPPAVGGPYTVKISGRETVQFTNVLVGDVWLCSGQSNMQFPLAGALNGAEEVKAANHPEIRFFNVAEHVSYGSADVPQGSWKVVSPETARQGLSAVAYFFARSVREKVKVPIGLVQAAVGGTAAETWTSAEALSKLGDFDVPLAEVKRLAAAGAPEYGNYVMHWYDQYDIGIKGTTWADPQLDDSGWKDVKIPGGFAELGVPKTPAVAWFRKEITLPDPLPSGPAMIFLGVVERMDTVYINGQFVGGSAWVENPRMYRIRNGVLKPGRNTVTVRVFKVRENGGFRAKPEQLRLVLGDKTEIPLAGAWKGRISVDARPPHPMPLTFENWPIMPTVLYEGMLKPIAPLAIAGALWYQGEANSERAFQYRRLLPAMIADWRKLFGQGDFPFYIAGLPAFKQRRDTPVDGDEWTELREAQALTVASVPNTCLAVTIDTGEADNIHPREKLPVGDRLARCALAGYYGEKVVFAGPTFVRAERLPGALRLHFTNTDGGLVAKGGKLEQFAVAGKDRKWHWAEARIEGDTVVVSSPEVPEPLEARYAWQSNPPATLYNGAGLPAVPFRTDNWPGITEGRRPY